MIEESLHLDIGGFYSTSHKIKINYKRVNQLFVDYNEIIEGDSDTISLRSAISRRSDRNNRSQDNYGPQEAQNSGNL